MLPNNESTISLNMALWKTFVPAVIYLIRYLVFVFSGNISFFLSVKLLWKWFTVVINVAQLRTMLII